jgi:hypothetical protein
MGIYFNPDPGQSIELPSMDAVRLLRRQLLASSGEEITALPEVVQSEAMRSMRLFLRQAANISNGATESH